MNHVQEVGLEAQIRIREEDQIKITAVMKDVVVKVRQN
jgi:hypothetical protein